MEKWNNGRSKPSEAKQFVPLMNGFGNQWRAKDAQKQHSSINLPSSGTYEEELVGMVQHWNWDITHMAPNHLICISFVWFVLWHSKELGYILGTRWEYPRNLPVIPLTTNYLIFFTINSQVGCAWLLIVYSGGGGGSGPACRLVIRKGVICVIKEWITRYASQHMNCVVS